VCTNGACGAQPACNPSQIVCAGACIDAQTDPQNCGACGHACTTGYSCAAGTCVSPQAMASCGLQTGSMAVMVAADGVVAYVPNGTWSGGGTGIKRMVIEGGSATSQTIPTTEIVSSCASNWVTGDTICTTQSSNIYVVNGTTITRTVTNGATTQQALSGGFCLNCGVAIDAVANQAWIETGLTIGGRALGGFQPFDFATSLFGPAISAGANPGAASGYWTSENVAVDSVRHLILSPNEFGNYQLVKYSRTATRRTSIRRRRTASRALASRWTSTRPSTSPTARPSLWSTSRKPCSPPELRTARGRPPATRRC
jgi:Stigma-specific protein, Stig1